jgi:hypothetical protein
MNLLAAVGDLSERHPEMRPLRAWELQWTLFALGYVDDLICEDEIAAAMASRQRCGRRQGNAVTPQRRNEKGVA